MSENFSHFRAPIKAGVIDKMQRWNAPQGQTLPQDLAHLTRPGIQRMPHPLGVLGTIHQGKEHRRRTHIRRQIDHGNSRRQECQICWQAVQLPQQGRDFFTQQVRNPSATRIGTMCMLQRQLLDRTRDFSGFVGLNHVSVLEVIEITQTDTALETLPDFLGVVFEAA